MNSVASNRFYSHVNYSVTKMHCFRGSCCRLFYSHVNYSVTKITAPAHKIARRFYSHVNYSVTKITAGEVGNNLGFTVT